jgi:hypothetical protein
LHNFAKKYTHPDRFHDLGTTSCDSTSDTCRKSASARKSKFGVASAKPKPTAKCGAQEERAAITRSIVSVNLVGVE